MERQKNIDIFRKNLRILLENDRHASMRNLSTSIGASDSYIRKVLAGDVTPSLERVDSICEFFDINSWELFYDAENDESEMLAAIELLNRMPVSMLPVVRCYLELLLQKTER
ncbi:MAG: helix-turn-helix domain-containing protein [Clostridiales bacterium]|nr:helix-turn-helix domain-containing protein [Clostridiales bacterium]